jgi:predicted ATP-dependent serine protease
VSSNNIIDHYLTLLHQRDRYKDSALITICQATKDGKMRGSNEIIHDADIEVIVANGLATTHKNRFKEKYNELKVF